MEFSIARLIQLMNRDFIIRSRMVFSAILIMIFLFFLITLVAHKFVNPSAGGAMNPIMLWYFIMLFIFGSFLTASSLGQFATSQRRLTTLLIPASTLEKVFVRWLYTFPLFAITLTAIFYFFFNGYIDLYGHYFSEETGHVAERLRTKIAPYFVLLYGIGHSIVLFFAHYYNRHAAIKGGLISVGIFLIIGLIRFLFDYSAQSSSDVWFMLENAIINNMAFIGDNPYRLLWIAPVFWVLTYRIARRKEV